MTKSASVWKSVVLVLAVIGLVVALGLVDMSFMHFSMMD